MDSFVGEIRIFPYSFPPADWAWCNGQELPVTQYQALFSVIGTTYGAIGESKFNLPSLTGSAPMGTGTGEGLTPRTLAASSVGAATITLTQSQMPAHTHGFTAQLDTGANTKSDPTGAWLTRGSVLEQISPPLYGTFATFNAAQPNAPLAASSISIFPAAAQPQGQPHSNQQPYLAVNFCISLAGEFPQRP